MSIRLLVSAVVFLGCTQQGSCWGPVGHRIVARLAQTQLTPEAFEYVRQLVPWHWHGNLSAMAVWGDDILYPDTNPTGYDNWQWSRPLHYINTEAWACKYSVEHDCSNDMCVDGAIRNYTKRLKSVLDQVQHEEALYFLIHFIGDVHQPLHVGFSDDYGGNKVKGHFMNSSYETKLHSLWDSGIINYRIRRDFFSNPNLYYEYIYQLMIRQKPLSNDDDIRQWINESIEIVCQHVYFDDNQQKMNQSWEYNLQEKYFHESYRIIEQRLAQGGRRLAIWINSLAKTPRKTIQNHLPVTTYVLIAVLIVNFILLLCAIIYCFIRYRLKHKQKLSANIY